MITAPVKQVLSGDTLVVLGAKGATLKVTLTGLRSPRFPQQPRAGQPGGAPAAGGSLADELFGLEAREFLRPLAVGKRVTFRIDQKHPNNADQVFATVWVGAQEGSLDASLNATVAKAGWARLKETDFTKQKDGELEVLLRKLCTEAEEAATGCYQNPNLSKRVAWDVDDFEYFSEALKKQKTTRAVIEYCRDATTFRCLLLDSRLVISFSMAGVAGARTPVEKSAQQTAEGAPKPTLADDPLATEARKFTEVRLLQREVTLEVGGYDAASKLIFGTVNHPNGSISEELLKNGLAKIVDWSVSMLPNKDDINKYRKLQKDAQDRRVGAWKDFVGKQSAPIDLKEYEGIVAEIISGDTLVIRIGTNAEQLREQPWTCEERRISLSSITAPRLGPKNAEGSMDERFAQEAKEYLRNKSAGQKVKVSVDYTRVPKQQEGSQPLPPRVFATVTLKQSGVNLGVEMVRQGLAEIVVHRADDIERSPHYDALLAAQQEAKQAKRNLHAPAKSESKGVYGRLQLQTDAAKAKAFLPHLQRERDAKHRCIVDWCSNGSRFGLDLAEQNCILSFALAGITCPSLARKQQKDSVDEPFAREALAFSRAHALHLPNVKCRIETMDRMGTFLGTLFVPFKNSEESLAVLLLERGLAAVHEYSAEQTRYKQQLYDAEKKAKEARLGIWKDWTEPAEHYEDEEDAGLSNADEMQFQPASVTDVVNGDTLFIRYKRSESELAKIDADLAKIKTGVIAMPRKGQLVAASFDDGSGKRFYRARVQFVSSKDRKARVLFIDFGNEDEIKFDDLRELPSAVASVPALALERKLAFVQCRDLKEEYGREAAIALSDLVLGRSDLVACDLGKFGVVISVKDADKQEEQINASINQEMVALGLGFVREKEARKAKGAAIQSLFASLLDAQDAAHRKRINLWQFGDPRDEED